MSLIARVISWTRLIFDTLYYCIESSFIFFQVSFFGANFFEGIGTELAIWMLMIMLKWIFTRTASTFLIKFWFYNEVDFLFQLHSLYHILVSQARLFSELRISFLIRNGIIRVLNWTAFMFDNLLEDSIYCFYPWQPFGLHVKIKFLSDDLMKWLHILTILAN